MCTFNTSVTIPALWLSLPGSMDSVSVAGLLDSGGKGGQGSSSMVPVSWDRAASFPHISSNTPIRLLSNSLSFSKPPTKRPLLGHRYIFDPSSDGLQHPDTLGLLSLSSAFCLRLQSMEDADTPASNDGYLTHTFPMTFKTPPRPCASPKPTLPSRLSHMDANRQIPIVGLPASRETPPSSSATYTLPRTKIMRMPRAKYPHSMRPRKHGVERTILHGH